MSCLWIIYFFYHPNLIYLQILLVLLPTHILNPSASHHCHCYIPGLIISCRCFCQKFLIHFSVSTICPLSACFPEPMWYLKPKPDINLLLKTSWWLLHHIYNGVQTPLTRPTTLPPMLQMHGPFFPFQLRKPMSALGLTWLAAACHLDLSCHCLLLSTISALSYPISFFYYPK